MFRSVASSRGPAELWSLEPQSQFCSKFACCCSPERSDLHVSHRVVACQGNNKISYQRQTQHRNKQDPKLQLGPRPNSPQQRWTKANLMRGRDRSHVDEDDRTNELRLKAQHRPAMVLKRNRWQAFKNKKSLSNSKRNCKTHTSTMLLRCSPSSESSHLPNR